MADVDRCICCGEIIPEGRQVCPQCENGAEQNGNKKTTYREETDRERLIGLIGDFAESWVENLQQPYGVESIADYLLEHGVTMPPCKIGDMVYITNHTGLVYEGRIRTIVYDTGDFAFGKKAIGKTVFPTREEAEQALKERERSVKIKREIKPCPQCGKVPMLGYVCGKYFILPTSKAAEDCLCVSFAEMHTTKEQEIEAWNRRVENA